MMFEPTMQTSRTHTPSALYQPNHHHDVPINACSAELRATIRSHKAIFWDSMATFARIRGCRTVAIVSLQGWEGEAQGTG